MDNILREYFKNLFIEIDSDIVLDDEQIDAITCDDDRLLIIAGAGTGKTTTMVGKVKYLVDIKKVDPSKILVISFTNKAVNELRYIVNEQFGIDCFITTFHSLAYRYVRHIFTHKKCIVVDRNFKDKVFHDYLNELYKKGKVDDLIDTFTSKRIYHSFGFGEFFRKNHNQYKDYDEFFEAYKLKKHEESKKKGYKNVIDEWVDKRLRSDENIITLRGENVKSAGEAVIANFLFKNGIEYYYEEVYPDLIEDRKVYKPDFTLKLGEKNIYLEYFGLDDEKYLLNKKRKIEFHKKYKNDFIYIDRKELSFIEKELNVKLKDLGFKYKKRSNKEIYEYILNQNRLAQVFKVKNLFYSTIDMIKESIKRDQYRDIVLDYINKYEPGNPEDDSKEKIVKQFNYINDFYIYYSERLYNTDEYSFDYADLIYFANKYISDPRLKIQDNYKYIIVDEYQDISDGEYELINRIAKKNKSKINAVGDDWQSIYMFRGSKIDYITHFEEYFKNVTKKQICTTYRNSQELIEIVGEFIQKNPDQIKKELVSSKHLDNPVQIVPFTPFRGDPREEYRVLKKLINVIHKVCPDHNILILARNNDDINFMFEIDDDFINNLKSRVSLRYVDDLSMDAMTMHKSKGLTYDEVIVIGLNRNFPDTPFKVFWLIDLFKPEIREEHIEFAEERRLFYVAMTRTKNYVFLLANTIKSDRSPFIDEIIKIKKEQNKEEKPQ